MSEFSIRPLYGGALEAKLPTRLNSLGDMLPIPDTQEVFSDPNNRCSYIIELLDSTSENDSEAIRMIYSDIIESNQASQNEILREENEDVQKFIIEGRMKVNDDWINFYLLIIRLRDDNTDLSFYVADPEGLQREDIEKIVKEFARSFKVNDRRLFC